MNRERSRRLTDVLGDVLGAKCCDELGQRLLAVERLEAAIRGASALREELLAEHARVEALR